MGTGALDSIKDELARLEHEKGELQAHLDELQEQKTPIDQVMALAKKFIENWPGVGELIQEATGDERQGILEQYVEVVQMMPTGRTGNPVRMCCGCFRRPPRIEIPTTVLSR